MLAPGGSVVVLPFEPREPENVNLLNAWKAQYGIDDQLQWVGGYDGRLDNRDDRIVLLRPEILAPNPMVVIHTAEDEVLYDDLRPWPTGADGQGGSLQRRSPVGFGNDASSWYSAPESPGAVRPQLPGDFDASGVVSALDVDSLAAQLQSGTHNLAFDLDGDARVTVTDRDVLVRVILGTNYGDANLDGIFNSSDLVQVFQRGHYEDSIAGNSGWSDGDWDGDGEFGTSDIVLAFQAGGYVLASMDAELAAAAVDAVWGGHGRHSMT
jgi:hypothetical protein